MRFKHLAETSAAALILLAILAWPANADPLTPCEVHQRQLLRVALSVAIGEIAVDPSAIARVVDQLWAPDGIDIDWIDETRAAKQGRLNAWVVVGRKTAESANVPALDPNLARRIVWISADEVVGRFEQTLSVEMHVPRESARHLMFGGGHLIERALGYAIAHRLGHSVMGLPHAASGLMSADYNSTPVFTAVSAANLDAEGRKLLEKRFGVGCAATR